MRPCQGEQLSNVALSKLFKKYAFKPVKGQEEISETFIENAFYIGNRARCYLRCRPVFVLGLVLLMRVCASV